MWCGFEYPEPVPKDIIWGCKGDPAMLGSKCDLRVRVEGVADSVAVYSPSEYVTKHLRSVPVWKASEWKTATKSPVVNRDLWERLFSLTACHRVVLSLAGVKSKGGRLAREAAATAVKGVWIGDLEEGMPLQQMLSSNFDAPGGVIHLPTEGLEWVS